MERSSGSALAVGAVASPCIGVCKLDEVTGLCIGCLRSAGEIGSWRDADDRLRLHILARVDERRVAGLGSAVPPAVETTKRPPFPRSDL